MADPRAELLRLYENTGDETYRRLADCLTPRRPRGRPESAAREAPSRIGRMNEMWLRDEAVTPYEAARQEVKVHGRGEHLSDKAAIAYLHRLYRRSEEETFLELKRLFGLPD
jgi:hypothetical protein